MILELRPEEKIWQVVKETYQEDIELPCFKLRKRDIIKIGRVRFKIRDIMSPAYEQANMDEDL
jgi:hypothetical protein